jgi:hypothetical protein
MFSLFDEILLNTRTKIQLYVFYELFRECLITALPGKPAKMKVLILIAHLKNSG